MPSTVYTYLAWSHRISLGGGFDVMQRELAPLPGIVLGMDKMTSGGPSGMAHGGLEIHAKAISRSG